MIFPWTSFCLPTAIVVDNVLATSAAVNTHVYIDTQEDEAATQTLLDVGEQTCYLHAACRTKIKKSC